MRVVIIILLVLTFPIWIGIAGGIFGLVVGLIGGFFGLIAGLFGAIVGLIGAIFDFVFHPWHHSGGWHEHGWHGPHFNVFWVALFVIVVAVLIRRRQPR